MAQEFKNYDRVYSEWRGRGIEYIGGMKGASLNDYQTWAYYDRFTEDYSSASIRNAVYFATGASEWQKFRVSLKGLTTLQKMLCLTWWWDKYVLDEEVSARKQFDIIRVNNYLGALKRGGQLIDDGKWLNVVK